MRVSLPVSGLDTSTPDQTVADGKCEELHNLRWESGSWHNIDPLKIKSRLSPTAGQEALFEKLTIIYHHPAAGDDAYIASIPNADGTINLFLATVVDGVLNIDTNNICPIYINNYLGGSVETISMRIALVSLKPVASDVSVEVNYKSTLPGQESRTIRFTIPQGFSQSNNYVNYAVSENNENAYPVPSRDDTYRYMVFTSEEAARNYNGSFATGLPAGIRISHFGNVLIVTDPTNRRVIHYYLNNGSYEEFQIPRPPVVRQSADLSEKEKDGCTLIKKILQSQNLEMLRFFNTTTGSFYFPFVNHGYFWGEICFFAAFQMSDGSIVAPSALLIAASEPFSCGLDQRYYESTTVASDHRFRLYDFYMTTQDGDRILGIQAKGGLGDADAPSVLAFMIRPHITITIPQNLNTQLITGVNIYSTRINPIWDSEKLKTVEIGTEPQRQRFMDNISNYWADNRLPEQPFYFIKSIPIDNFTDGQYSMYLGGELLEGIEHNTAYEPVDAHSLYFDIAKEYNSRIHAGGSLAIRLFEGYGSDYFPATGHTPEHYILTSVRIDDIDYLVESASPEVLYDDQQPIYNKILSYPDSRATFIYSSGSDSGDGIPPASIKLQPAAANNFAWAVYRNDTEEYEGKQYKYVKYSAAFHKTVQVDWRKFTASEEYVPKNNKLRVSAPNNPFSFPLANSYAIGTENNRILAVNSAAIEMSDAKFGEFPLYVFTDEGIFTLQSGSGEVLYSATIPLNYDRIVNPATLAVNHNVLYVTARGIMAMFSNESRLISEPINNLHNTPPLDYLRTAKMCYQPAHNEVIVWNPAHAIGRAVAGTRAYVFSLDGGYWSTRDLEGVKLNTDELVVHTSNQFLVLDLSEEEARSGQPVRIRLVTRPLKFGSTEFKRLETFVARLHTQSPQSLRLLFEGSTDLKAWTVLRDTGFFRTDRDTLLRRFPGSIRFLRVTLEADLDAGFELAQFDAEYYTRFLHRLR